MRLVIADDWVLLRESVASVLAREGFDVVGQAGDGAELIRKVAAHRPDVAVMDVRMPPRGRDEGVRAAMEIRERFPGVGALLLSQYLDEAYVLELLRGGAEGIGYLLKQRISDVSGFAEAVRQVGAGGSALDPEVISQMLLGSRRSDPVSRLSDREREVLGLIAEGRSNQAIARALVVTRHTVEKHVTSIFHRLGLERLPDTHQRVLAVRAFLDRDRPRAPLVGTASTVAA